MFPRKKLSTDYEETGDYGQYQYTYCQIPRRLVANSQIDLYNDASIWTSPSSIIVDGWVITEHSEPVDNTETGFKIIGAAGELATVRPWWGWYSINSDQAPASGNISYHVSTARRHALAVIKDGNVWFGVAGNAPFPISLTTSDTSIAADWCCIKWDSEGILYLWTDEAGTIKERIWQGSFGVATTIATGTKPAAIIHRGLHYLYWVDGTAIKGQVRDNAGNVVVSTFTAVASGVDDQGIDADYSIGQGGAFRVGLWYTASGTLTQVTGDGVTFS